VLVNYFSDTSLPKAEYDAGMERLNMSGQHDVVLQIEAAVQRASKASEDKASKMGYYAAQGRGIGRKVGLDCSVVVCVWIGVLSCVFGVLVCVFAVLFCASCSFSYMLCIMFLRQVIEEAAL
jgi:hypothetical protein